ncbi:MAG: group I intron-associated PD-(D/E)XK endonuclease, partial [Cyanobacteria bacterium P01_F01_bin.4]
DNRRTKTNRRGMVRDCYRENDFDFAMAYIESLDLFYIVPVTVFISYGSEIHLVEAEKRQRKPRSADYRNAWVLIENWAQSRKPAR